MRDLKTDHRVAVHEAAHCVAARALGMPIGSVTIDAGDGYEGRVFGPAGTVSQLDAGCIVAEALLLLPGIGEDRADAAEWMVHAQARTIELMAGVEGELLTFPDEATFIARQDGIDAQAYAGSLCRSPAAVDAFISYARREAAELLGTNRSAHRALTDALLIHRTMSGERVDQVIAEALAAEDIKAEQARRADWQTVQANAAAFLNEKVENDS